MNKGSVIPCGASSYAVFITIEPQSEAKSLQKLSKINKVATRIDRGKSTSLYVC